MSEQAIAVLSTRQLQTYEVKRKLLTLELIKL